MKLSERMLARIDEFMKQRADPNAIPATTTEIAEWATEVAQFEDKLSRLDVEMLTNDDDGNPVGCGMDLLDWQAHLQTELGITHLKIRQLEAENERLKE